MENRILGVMTALWLLFGTVVPAFAQNTDSDKACQDALDARKQIEILDKKYAELKQKAYSEWEQQSKSGQYSGSWEEYAQKFFVSDEVKEIQNLRQKYTEIDQKCVQYGPTVKSEPSNPKNKTCFTADYENIKKTFFTIEQKMIAAKERYYKEWESLSKSGKYSDSWDQYAKEKLHTSPEAIEYQKAQAKYGSTIQLCQSEQVLSQPKMLQRPAECNESEFEAAKKAMMESDSKVTALKERLYLEWKTLIDAGKITDSWNVYMKQHFDVAPEVKEWRQLQDKFSDIFHICTPANIDVIKPNSQKSELSLAQNIEKQSNCLGKKKCITGKVKKIVDGDTIIVEKSWIRLSMTNTPERGQKGFNEATAFTSKLCPYGSTVTVDQDDKQPTDKYKRILGKVFCGGKILNSELLYNGYANISTKYCSKSEFATEDWAKKYGC